MSRGEIDMIREKFICVNSEMQSPWNNDSCNLQTMMNECGKCTVRKFKWSLTIFLCLTIAFFLQRAPSRSLDARYSISWGKCFCFVRQKGKLSCYVCKYIGNFCICFAGLLSHFWKCVLDHKISRSHRKTLWKKSLVPLKKTWLKFISVN